jgi:cytochrome P450 / NADPH-cytochrome P450 reductase
VTTTPHADSDTHLSVNEPVPLLGVRANRIELRDIATRTQLATVAAHAGDAAEQQRLLALAGDDEASQSRYREGVFAPQVGSRSARRLSILRAAVRGVPRSDAAARAAVLVDLLFASGGDGCVTAALLWASWTRQRAPVLERSVASARTTWPISPPTRRSTRLHSQADRSSRRRTRRADDYGWPRTGIAPFRGFLQERAAHKMQGCRIGPSLLFFGSRDLLQDFLYEEEMRGFEAAGVTRLICAFSREPGRPKTYVQQAVAERCGRSCSRRGSCSSAGRPRAWRRRCGRRSLTSSSRARARRIPTGNLARGTYGEPSLSRSRSRHGPSRGIGCRDRS